MKSARKQHGVVLFIALIVLVAMSLAGVALWRSIGTGVLIAGNIAIQRGAVTSSDVGIETARTWLMNQTPAVLNNTQAQGYVSNWDNIFDATTFNWDTQGTLVTTDAAGFSVRYVVHRLCSMPNVGSNAPNQQCLSLNVAGGGSGRGGGSYGVMPLTGTTYIYYRITSRALGPRNTVSYTQAIMY
jgi:Tfp pilus assembly protein PilX